MASLLYSFIYLSWRAFINHKQLHWLSVFFWWGCVLLFNWELFETKGSLYFCTSWCKECVVIWLVPFDAQAARYTSIWWHLVWYRLIEGTSLSFWLRCVPFLRKTMLMSLLNLVNGSYWNWCFPLSLLMFRFVWTGAWFTSYKCLCWIDV